MSDSPLAENWSKIRHLAFLGIVPSDNFWTLWTPFVNPNLQISEKSLEMTASTSLSSNALGTSSSEIRTTFLNFFLWSFTTTHISEPFLGYYLKSFFKSLLVLTPLKVQEIANRSKKLSIAFICLWRKVVQSVQIFLYARKAQKIKNIKI